MDPAGPPLRTVGCAAQIELAKVARTEWNSQMRRGRKQRDVCGSGWRTRPRRDGQRWRAIYRHGRLHQARPRDPGETAPALDSQIYGLFLTAPGRWFRG